jgi:LPXTG-site transpeptidase (sortase) family protein
MTKSMFVSSESGFQNIDDAPRDIAFWKERLRMKLGKKFLENQDGNAASYVVIPTTGIVTPITTILGSDSKTRQADFDALVSGRDIKVNPYLHDGVVQYPNSANPGQPGNMVIAGHSSYWLSGLGRYKTVFGNMIEVDAGEEVWVYERQADKSYKLYRYRVSASYNTTPSDVDVLVPTGGSQITLFTCTPIGGLSGRWIVK